MELKAVSTVEPKRRILPALGLSAATGAAVGSGMRYILPTKEQLKSADSFVSSAAMNARSANRSILKYGGIGALVASGLTLISKLYNSPKKSDANVEYTKLGALIDAPDYACEIMWYSE